MNRQYHTETGFPIRALPIIFLFTAACGLIISLYLGGKGVWGWTQAFFEAAMVGGLADWFAVVALFRHPLGLPIPHTAIIPNNKSKLAIQLSQFIQKNFLESEMILSRLTLLNPAGKLTDQLAAPENVGNWARHLRLWTYQGLTWLDDTKLQEVMAATAREAFSKWQVSHSLASILQFVTEQNHHHTVLKFGLDQLEGLLARDTIQHRLTEVLSETLTKEWPLIMGAANAVKLAPWLSQQLVSRLPNFVEQFRIQLENPDDEHPEMDRKIEELIKRLAADPVLSRKIETLKNDLINSQFFQAFSKKAVAESTRWLKEQLGREDSPLARQLERALSSLGAQLGADPEFQAAINRNILNTVAGIVPDLSSGIVRHIQETINHWDDEKIIRELEQGIGKDLQFIRINGTLAGGFVGLALHGLQWLILYLHPI